ncbi:unnamed protein product [Larinioides sclopetarius]|uniref:BHLH domain-containing protein n=1 Tax=Larinioides sclopetarius TaxID=280406 RepID=A0AAV2B5X5_9ARAC
MQSINAGFQSLRALLPHREGEKLSKAAILQSTADYVYQLEQEKTRLLEQNSQLSRRMLNSPHINHDSDGSCSESPLPKRKKREPADCVDEGIGSSSPSRSDNGVDDVKRELIDLRLQLEQERTLRLLLEEQIRSLESRLYPSGNRPDSVEQIHLQYHSGTEDNIKSLNMGHESGLGSPQSQISSQDVESSHEISLRESTPELSGTEIPEDLSGKNNSMLLQCVDELSLSDVTTIPGLLMSPNHINVSSSFPVEIGITPQQAEYKVSTSRQNLETIVEAIRHVEGDHMFRDDTTESEETRSIKEEKLSVTEQQYTEQIEQPLLLTNRDFSFQHQIIRNAPLTQSRPGVIVSNLS